MAEKKTKKKANSKKSTSNTQANKNVPNNTNILTIGTLILVVVQLIMIASLMLSQNTAIGTNMGELEEKINSIETKVNAIDNFFASNVQGYNSGSDSSANQVANSDPAEIDIEGEPYLGNPDAEIVIVEFSDYECPYCAAGAGTHDVLVNQFKSRDPSWEAPVPKLKELAREGKILFVYKDFPLERIHPNAKAAAVAANCVFKELGNYAYFEMHDKIFEEQSSVTASNLKTWALEIGMDESKYDTCIADPQMSAEVDQDIQEGSSVGVTGTPAFFVNGNLLSGAHSFATFEQLIEEASSN